MLSISFHPFPEIKTARLLLREIDKRDIHEVFFLRSDEDVLKYINKPRATSLDDIRDFISRINTMKEKNEGINWAVTLSGTDKLIGNICLFNIKPEHHRAEVGYVLNPAHQGKGIMQEAIRAVLDYGFKTLGLHSIEANVNPANAASIKLLEKNNFVREAYFRENFFFDDQFLDTAIYSLLATETKS
jgi:[ribosomal protein S5]-alanine N-acetyltransferase